MDAMALAVEGSEVMLIGVSRAYKESSNCRMEAQYALQKKKPLVPLKLTDGYEADGWLGLVLGTSMWYMYIYAFYGETLSSESAFEDRMDSLARELGSRGRADAVVAPVPIVDQPEPGRAGLTREQLGTLKLGQLVRRAVAEGVDPAALDEAEDSDDPRATIITLLLGLEGDGAAAALLRVELEEMKLSLMALTRRAIAAGVSEAALEAVDDAADVRQAIVELIVQAEL